MAFIGNLNGPRKSVILAELGWEYFGITAEELYIEIEYYKLDESSNNVDPVYMDEKGDYYLIFNAPDGGIQRFYLEKNGYKLTGEIKVERKV